MSLTLYYTFGVGTAVAMREALAKIAKSGYLACIIPPQRYVRRINTENLEEMKAIFADPRVILVDGQDDEQIRTNITNRLPMLPYMEAVEYLDIETPLTDDFPRDKFHAMVADHLRRIAAMSAMLFNTAHQSIGNYFLNAYETFIYQDWAGLGRQLSRPLVIIGMGPSMADEIDTLRDLAHRVHIMCVDNALKYLMANHVPVDMVAQVEWNSRSMDFYEGCDTSKITLICLAGVYPDVLQTWKGPILTMPNYQVAGAFPIYVGKATPPFFGSNVGTFSIQTASNLGVKEAWLVGFDFGAPCYLFFHPGSISLIGETYPSMTRHWSPMKMDYQYTLRQQESIMMKDREGKDMVASMSFESDRRLIESMIAKSNTKFFNSSRHGREIVGATYAPLKTLVQAVQSEPLIRQVAPDRIAFDNGALFEDCQNKLGHLSAYSLRQSEIQKKATDLLALHEHGHKIETALKEFSQAVEAMQASDFSWIESTISTLDPELRHIFTAETIRARDLTNQTERLLHWAGIVRDFYPSFGRFTGFLRDFLEMLKQKCTEARS